VVSFSFLRVIHQTIFQVSTYPRWATNFQHDWYLSDSYHNWCELFNHPCFLWYSKFDYYQNYNFYY